MYQGNILTLDDLENISVFLAESGYGNANIRIELEVNNKQLLNKINADIFYRLKNLNNNEEDTTEYADDDNIDEVVVNMDNVEFVYKLSNSNEEK